MTKSQTFTAKTVEDAKALAGKTWGVPVSEITFEVLEEPKRGILGVFGKGDAKVKATYTSPEKVQEVAEPVVETVQEVAEPVVETVQEVAEPVVEDVQAVAEPVVETVQEVAEPVVEDVQAVAEPVVETVQAVAEPVTETAPTAVEPDKVQDDEDLISGEPSALALEKIEKAKTYLSEILEKMGVKAELVVTAGAESALIEIVAPNSGAVIGKRGETLDALQYLTFMIANRGDKEYYRIILNSANYRERRRKTLEELAHKIAKNVLRSGRPTTLEPMNPYERRIIHSAIAEVEGVNSKSIGEEPYRKVVISSNNAKPPRKRNSRRGHDGDGRRDNNRGDHRRNNHPRRDRHHDDSVQHERISMDSMKTSFEKDYKRPKAEDEINAGLYGKIEF